jgi:putative transposase
MGNIRSDQAHKLTTKLTQNYSLIGIEDLNVSGMMSNHHLARSVADMSFFEFRRQLGYKAETANVKVVVADRWYASSKTCHICGTKAEVLGLGDREWICEWCDAHHDRDFNASQNLKYYAINNA